VSSKEEEVEENGERETRQELREYFRSYFTQDTWLAYFIAVRPASVQWSLLREWGWLRIGLAYQVLVWDVKDYFYYFLKKYINFFKIY
jgi:hypothetical protein